MESELIEARDDVKPLPRRDAVHQENGKLKTFKSKLENLCRELQKQNKSILAESKRSIETESTKRQELADNFNSTISDISAKIDEQSAERTQIVEENADLREKLKSFLEKDVREKQFAQELKTKDLELKVAAQAAQKEEVLSAMKSQCDLYSAGAVAQQ